MLNSYVFLFQVSTKEVIKFQMVGFNFSVVWTLLPWVTVCRFSGLGLIDVILGLGEHYHLFHNSLR